jgi:hypothetical protein
LASASVRASASWNSALPICDVQGALVSVPMPTDPTMIAPRYDGAGPGPSSAVASSGTIEV